MFEIVEQQNSMTARIKVIGIGGGGSNAVNTMITANLSGVDFMVANTDAQSLVASEAAVRIPIMRERDVEIRLASAADAPGITELHGRSFSTTYPDLSRSIAGLNQGLSRRVTLWTDRIENSPMGHATFVAHQDLRIVGFVFVGPSGDEDHLGGHTGQVFSIHVDPTGLRGGIGKRLLNHALGFLGSSGFEEATLWVVASNDRARRFYEALGWRRDGTHRRETAIEGPEGDEVDVVRYRLELIFGMPTIESERPKCDPAPRPPPSRPTTHRPAGSTRALLTTPPRLAPGSSH